MAGSRPPGKVPPKKASPKKVAPVLMGAGNPRQKMLNIMAQSGVPQAEANALAREAFGAPAVKEKVSVADKVKQAIDKLFHRK